MICLQVFFIRNFVKYHVQNQLRKRAISYQTIGKRFELSVVKYLHKHGMQLETCGGAGDRGVDFRGIWKLSREVKIIGQCKCVKRKLGPIYLRELEGTLSHEEDKTIGLIVTNNGFTKDAYNHFMSSSFPLVISVLTISENIDADIDDTLGTRMAKLEDVMTGTDTEYHTDTMSDNFEGVKITRNVYEDDIIETFYGQLLLMDLNLTARKLLPKVSIAKAMNPKGLSTLLLCDDNRVITTL